MNVYIIEDDLVFSTWLSRIVRKAMDVRSLTVFQQIEHMGSKENVDPEKFDNPDVIFVDNHLGYNKAFNHILKLRELFPMAVILTMSAFTHESEAVLSLNNGANQYFSKSADFSKELIDYLASDDFDKDLRGTNLTKHYYKTR